MTELTGSPAYDAMMLDAENIVGNDKLKEKYLKTLNGVIYPDCDYRDETYTKLWKRILRMSAKRFPINTLVYALAIGDIEGDLNKYVFDTLKDDKRKAHRELINKSQETIIIAYKNMCANDMEEIDSNPFQLFQFCTLTKDTIDYLVEQFTDWCWHDDHYEYAQSILECLEDAKQWEVLEKLEKHDWKKQYYINMNIPHFDEMRDWHKEAIEHLVEIIGQYLRDHRIAKDLEKLAKWSRLSIVR